MKVSLKCCSIAVLISLLIHMRITEVQADAGDLDPSFGVGGRVVTGSFGALGEITDIAVLNDGKILTLGDVQRFQPPFDRDFVLARYVSDGSLDTTFGNGGEVITDFLGGLDFAKQLAVQPDGKILAAGEVSQGSQFGVARYQADGILDSTFGIGGKVVTDFDAFSDVVNAMVLQGDGKIVLAGSTISFNVPGLTNFAMARYNTDGSLDSTFGVGGKVITDIFGSVDSITAVTQQSDGKIVVAGTAVIPGLLQPIVVARYNVDGSLDSSFGTGGKAANSFSLTLNRPNVIGLQADGKLLVVGRIERDFAVIRYNTNGSLDLTFGSGGKTTTTFSDTFDFVDEATDFGIQPDGRIVVAGFASFPVGVADSQVDFALARYNPNGFLDQSFGTNGKVITSFPSGNAFAFAMALQPDGKIVAGGGTSGLFALARYVNNLSSFDTCLQDDSNGSILKINTTNGDYVFSSCTGVSLSGTGTLIKRGGTITLQVWALDRQVLANADLVGNRATASIRLLSQGLTFTLIDRNTANNTCHCR